MEEKVVLSPRLQTVFSMIPECGTVVDVGSDHGKLGACCLLNNRCKNVIATDIHELPAQRTEEMLKECGLSDVSRVYVADGLSGVPVEEDMTVVIAGMGGLEICKIIQNALSEHDPFPMNTWFVLQPQRSFYEVRSFLAESGFAIRDEKIASERGRFYTVILAQYDRNRYSLSDEEYFLGPVILSKRPKWYNEYIAHEEQVMRKRALGDPKCAEILKNWEKLI